MNMSASRFPDAGIDRRANDLGTTPDRRCLPDIALRISEPAEVAVPPLVLICEHHTVMGIAGIRPVEVAEQRVIAEDYILTAGLHAQALNPGQVPDQHVSCPDAQAATVTSPVALAPLWFRGSPPFPALALLSVASPRCRIDDFHVEVHVRGQIIANAQAHPLLHKEIIALVPE